MADNHVERGSMEPHVRTYGRVMGMLKWGAVAAAIVAGLVIWLISK